MRIAALVILVFATLVSFAWIFTPAFLLRPFESQTPADVALAYALRSRAAVATLLLLGLGVGAAAMFVRRLSSVRARLFTAFPVLLLAGFAILARQNHFEWLFAPIQAPQFVAAADAAHVADDDLVLGVQLEGEAAAYPVRALAYHHVVNDVVAGEPIVSTY